MEHMQLVKNIDKRIDIIAPVIKGETKQSLIYQNLSLHRNHHLAQRKIQSI